MGKRVISVVFILIISTISFATLKDAPIHLDSNLLRNIGRPTRMAEHMEEYFKENLAFKEPLQRLMLELRTSAGYHELNNIYLAEDGLIPHLIPSEDSSLRNSNSEGVLNFAQRTGIPTALLLLPTASAICQEQLPPYGAEIQYNQHGFIQMVAKRMAGNVAAVDVYPTLYAARKEYLYCRTANELTSNGSFYVYQTLVKRLGLIPKQEADFHKQFIDAPYYGELYRQWGLGGVRGDAVTLYHYTASQSVQVSHWLRYEDKVYHSLFPAQAAISGNPMDNILGGHSPRIDIDNYSLGQNSGQLLVLGDANAMNLLPFLALHYGRITYADPFLLTDSELAGISTDGYTQAVFCFSVESYLNNKQTARAATVGTAAATVGEI